MTYVIQSIQLRRDKFSKEGAMKWMRDHGYPTPKLEVSHTYYHFRQIDPDRLRGGRFRTLALGDVGSLVAVYF